MALPRCMSRTVLLLLLLLCSPGVPLIQLRFQLAGISLQKKKKTPAENSHLARVVPAVTSHCHPASFPGGLWFAFTGRCPPRPFSPPSSAPGAPGCGRGFRSLAADTAQLDKRDALPFLSQNPAGSGAGSVPSGAEEPWVLQCHRCGC